MRILSYFRRRRQLPATFDEAWRCLFRLAQRVAGRYGHEYVGTEHVP
jgi:hypothetical protein